MRARSPAAALRVAAISFDFGNTLVRVDRAGLAATVGDAARVARERGIATDEAAFLEAWAEERARQFREDLPRLREVDLRERVVRVMARLRGAPPPPENVPWDDEGARRIVDPGEVEAVVDAYSAGFVARMAPAPDAGPVLEQLAGSGFPIAIVSNWPLAETIDRYVESHGWLPHLRAVVVSQRVGVIKPHRVIFDHARERLGVPAERIIHVGDDWAADVVGAVQAGWRAAYLRDRQLDTPLPTSTPPGEALTVEPGDAASLRAPVAEGSERADLVIGELEELVPLVRHWDSGG